MLDTEKIEMMTKLALYEQKEGKKDIILGKYFKTDYVRLQILRVALSTTIGYLLILIMIVIYKLEYLIQKAVVIDYKNIGMKTLGIYIILLIIYVIAALIGYSLEYDISRKRLAKFYKNLNALENHIEEQNQEL
ncbi:MAG TPA: hypothetical protein GXZ90_01130 [Clostridiales bacterium]|nr:hypothetical protein [Clostridiales bacterium]